MTDKKHEPNPPPPPDDEAPLPDPTIPYSPDGSDESSTTVEMDSGGRKPRRIGGYRVIRKLGEGGMGVVYEAEQQEPRRPVALKVVRGGPFVDEHRIRLFQREAQALARLRHPYIAGIYEAGRTDEGQHFFAMELVRGLQLLTYLQRLPLEGPEAGNRRDELLDLFLKICEAISYAHQRGVIHRDLKPSNIMVTTERVHAGSTGTARHSPQVKILDFGLARMMDTDMSVVSVVTEAGSVQGTLSYMSPEQSRGNPDEIDLRTDVYSLGVILYQMLTGELPYETGQVSLPAAVRVICEEDPRRPSTIRRQLRGDLETIILKALEKDPARRFQSVAALMEDIERFLASQPILARPPSTVYQLKKLVQRNKALFAFVGTGAVLVVAFGILMSFMYAQSQRNLTRATAAEGEAAREAKTAQQVSDFLIRLFEVSDPTEARGNTITAREILDEGASRIDEELEDQPEVQATMMQTMGIVYDGLGLYDQAASLVEKSVSRRRELHGGRDLGVAEGLNYLAGIYKRQGEHARAESLYLASISIREEELDPNDPVLAMSYNNLATIYEVEGRYAEAGSLLVHAVRIWEESPEANDTDLAMGLSNLGALYWRLGSYAEVEPLWKRCIAIWERTLGKDHPDLASAYNNLAALYSHQDRDLDAEPYFRRALMIREKTLGPDHPLVASDLNNLGSLCRRTGRYKDAETLLKRALSIWEASLGPVHRDVATGLNNLAELYIDLERFDEAESLLRRALTIREEVYGPEHPAVALVLHNLGVICAAEGRTDEAEPLYARALSIRRRGLGPKHYRVAETLEAYAKLLRATDRPDEAGRMEEEAASIRQELASVT